MVCVVFARREQAARFAAFNLDGDATVELWELNRKTASTSTGWTKAENKRAFAEADANADGGLGPDEYADLAAARGEVPAMVEGAWRAFFADVQQQGMRTLLLALILGPLMQWGWQWVWYNLAWPIRRFALNVWDDAIYLWEEREKFELLLAAPFIFVALTFLLGLVVKTLGLTSD